MARLNWDIGPIWQTQRKHRYQEVIQTLLDKKLAYRSYETEAELQAMRAAQEQQKQAPPLQQSTPGFNPGARSRMGRSRAATGDSVSD